MARITIITQALFYSQEKSQVFTKNNCATDYSGSQVTSTVPYGKYTSTISQADADAKAQAELNLIGQQAANNQGICTQTTFWNVQRSKTFKRNNCNTGYEGGDWTYIIPAHTFAAGSVAAANALADAELNAKGQTLANQNGNGTCTQVVFPYEWQIDPDSYTCEVVNGGKTGVRFNTVLRKVVAASATSHAGEPLDVNNRLVSVSGGTQHTMPTPTNSPLYRTENATNCPRDTIYTNTLQSRAFTRNNCQTGFAGSSVTYTVAAGKYSALSQAAANQLAINEIDAQGQGYANTNGTCTQTVFYNDAMSQPFTRNNCGTDFAGSVVNYSVPAGKYSAGSKAAANTLAQNEINTNGQANANTVGTCTQTRFGNQVRSQEFTRANCGADYTGGKYVVTVPANTYFASTQNEANQLADNHIAANGQSLANINGTCTQTRFWNVKREKSFTRNNCGTDFTGSTVNYVVEAHTYSSDTQAGADALALADINSKGQAYANGQGTCTKTTFWNVQKSGIFTRNNCPAGTTPGSYTYIVPAHTYSANTQAAADQMAQDAVNASGQNLANANATCTENIVTYTPRWIVDNAASFCEEFDLGSADDPNVLAHPEQYLNMFEEPTSGTGMKVVVRLSRSNGELVTISKDVDFDYSYTLSLIDGGDSAPVFGSSTILAGQSEVQVGIFDSTDETFSNPSVSNITILM